MNEGIANGHADDKFYEYPKKIQASQKYRCFC